MYSKWLEHTKEIKAQSALARHGLSKLSYGEQVYRSPSVNSVTWLVLKYQNEYNVFTERMQLGNKSSRVWVACFRGEQRALEFALRMVLICSGKISRKDLHTT